MEEATSDDFLGMWALELDYASSNAGWLEVKQQEGYLDADMLWRSGSVFPVDFVFQVENNLILTRGSSLVRTRDADGNPLRVQHHIEWFDIQKDGPDRIVGQANFPARDGQGVETIAFTGVRIPGYGEAPDIEYLSFGEPLILFNGEDLSGWELHDKNRINGWKAVDGVLVNDPEQKEGRENIRYGNLRTTDTFEDFRLSLEVNVPEGSNSGIYLRGIYEIQVFDSYGKELDSHHMGGLYSRITPTVSAEKPAGEWQSFDIILCQRHVTVVLNGQKIIDNQPVMGVTGEAITSNEFVPGPLYLQGDHGKVSYRNIILTPIVN
jgi:hypothetical protein